ncbi:alpha/beta hydrolase [uncultured Polaribacter sp.]|uniref:alpha/beta hydrolase n=1 Tax=uncultured Polaribacter sp. TaxID=174711 RepID=UPI0027748C89|nr:alpha/beta hydrolase [Polaribacter sp.]|tara:strand:+ start:45 stop:941 length:897 start_codon:yes stop_codon:yes gene_type:complete
MRYKILLLILIFNCLLSFSQSRYVDAVFSEVTTKTYSYAIKKRDTLKFDLYQPVNDNYKKRPLFVIIHGGGFKSGARNDKSIVSLANGIAKKGYVVASVDYRLIDKNTAFNCNLPVKDAFKIYGNAEEDVLEAIAYILRSNFKIDSKKIILFGASAGAETLLNITYNKSVLKRRSRRTRYISIAGVISISGAIFNSSLMKRSSAVPGVFYHGAKDRIIPYFQGAHHSCSITSPGYFLMDGSKKIVEKLESYDKSFMFYGYKNKGHDIFNLPSEDFRDAFIFIKKVVFEGAYYQMKLIK